MVVGATERPSIGRSVIRSLQTLRYPGKIYPVNPKYKSILGIPCFSDFLDIGETVDLMVICLGHNHVYAELEKASRRGVGGAVIYGAGYAESGQDGQQLQQAITQLCVESDIALCGPNVMGISSPHDRCHTYMIDLDDPDRLAGNVGLISQSGSVCIALTNDVRRYGFSHVISSGNEAVIGTADYLNFLVDDENTAVIALFLERVSGPLAFMAALDRASQAQKPVVVLKGGKSTRAEAAVITHSGGVAGEARSFSAMLQAHGAIEVASLEELSEVLVVCQSKPVPTHKSVGVITGSGGLAELMLDVSDLSDVELPPLSTSIKAQAEEVIGTLTGDGNPLDAWGNGNYLANYPAALAALGHSDEHHSILFGFDSCDFQPMQYEESGSATIGMLAESKAKSGKPHFALSSLQGVFNTTFTSQLREQGIPILSGISSSFSAIAKVAGRMDDCTHPVVVSDEFCAVDETEVASLLLRNTINEFDAKKLLATCQLPVAEERIVTSFEECRQAAIDLGYPVVLKGLSDDLPHKTEHRLVALNIRNGQQLLENWESMQAIRMKLEEASRRDYLIQAQAPQGVEVIVGVNRDPQFGLVLVVGAGGVLTEMLNQVSLRMLPIREGQARAMLNEAKLEPHLKGFRDSPAVNIDALVAAIEAVANFAAANAHWLESIDVNPIIAHRQSCIAVDALIVPRKL